MKLMTDYDRDNYAITVSHGALAQIDTSLYDKVIMIVDETVLALHDQRLRPLCASSEVFAVSAGEELKSLPKYSEMINRIIEAGVTRSSAIVAVGGGSVGDFAGFIAATLLRGIDFIQVPTTILAHDSAIGGKVGINATLGKNLIGAFKRPAAVIYDLDFLDTLPYSEKLSGFGEIIKHAMLDSDDTLAQLMAAFPARQQLEHLADIDEWLIRGMQQKLTVVQADEHETGLRKTLNLGHTFGHAVEFTHHIPHGHAVMHGLIYTWLLSGRDITALKSWFKALELPMIELRPFVTYLSLMAKDKKNSHNEIQFVLLDDGPRMETVSEERLYQTYKKAGGSYES
ncbi:3-dehydroquinate synthase [Macrococcus carouselicus]|uniref:3-dehydroquinate synthase n=1 Tax=Macrococcus carouselicus TaxID=69969 RepID=A0A9Q8CPA7_9STAP|nr:3-dehydroquinate synthase family protein [Macrococcus carouselicus]TDM04272.1 3-dehydroquinate synthase [Macrococcus carouselicus]